MEYRKIEKYLNEFKIENMCGNKKRASLDPLNVVLIS
jgi:hypothetical protein